MSDRAVCIHGHFYQPPRDDPWTGEIERQPSAAPFHDWNERIAAECYGPNTAARILDASGRIEAIVENFSRISFDVGPTLLSWLEERAPRIYRAILAADGASARRFSGHGSAIAQGFHHAILPLANARDRRTEIVWGIADFQSRYGRSPEGFWLPETAVDVDTLEVLAEENIRFTILAPRQAARVRKVAESAWTDVSGGTIDGTRPYFAPLPSGRRIALFFYDGEIARGIAFERLLDSSDALVERLTTGAGGGLVHVATDGESYGHHHPHGDMALAAALAKIEREGAVRLTNYGEHLERNPPEDEVEIVPRTSWSCEHGVGRWAEDCGCRLAVGSQAWRGPLRGAFDWLRDTLAPRFEDRAGALLTDPWKARDAAVALFSGGNADEFFTAHQRRTLSHPERRTALRLLDLQRNALRIFTSCGWFFDDVAGIESRQVILYAARAVELAEDIFGEPFEPEFLDRLRMAHGNADELPDAAAVYRRYVRPPGSLSAPESETSDPGRALSRAITDLAEAFEKDPADPRRLESFIQAVELARAMPFSVPLWDAQNGWWRMRTGAEPVRRRAKEGDRSAEAWIEEFGRLRELLGFASGL